LQAIDREIFEHHAGARPPMSLFLLPYFFVFTAIGIGEYCHRRWLAPPLEATEVVESDQPSTSPSQKAGPGWLFPLFFGLLMLGFYLFLTNDLGTRGGQLPHGGFLKARLAILPPLISLACLREPANTPTRLVLRALTVVLLGVNLLLVTQTFQEDNKALEQFTTGIEAVGGGHRLKVIGTTGKGRLANPLTGARHYYCLDTGNVSLDNYEASTPHFPIKYRDGPRAQMATADVVIYWRTTPGTIDPLPDLIFADGNLRIYRRPQGP
jgi:hypothetical protein